ncbi:MAG: DUF4175 family protein [Candidatus Brocadiia bacterium]
MEQINQLTGRLAGVRARIRMLFLADGLSRIVIYAAAFAALTFAIDWSMPELPPAVRLVFLGAGAVGLFWLAYRYVIYPLRTTISDDSLVIYLERKYPQLKERLLSALQLSISAPPTQSPELIQALVNEAFDSSREMNFNAIINSKHQKRLALSGIALAALCGLYIISYPGMAGIWLNRLFGGEARWPKRTNIAIEVRNAPDNIAARDRDVAVLAKVVKGSISKAYINYRVITADKPTTDIQTERMSMSEKDVFRFDFLRVKESFEFYVTGGDDRTNPIVIKVLSPPGLERIYCQYEYPEYIRSSTGLKNTGRIEGGNVKAPVGTAVTIIALANIDIGKADMSISSDTGNKQAGIPAQLITMALAKDAEGRPRQVEGRFTAMNDGAYAIKLTGLNSLSNHQPIEYPISVTRDTAPVIKVQEPTVEYKYVTPDASVPMALLVTDDYAVARIWMGYSLAGESGSDATAERQLPMFESATPAQQSKVETSHVFELAEIKPKDGDVIRYYFGAEDNCAIPRPNQSRTGDYRLIVISPVQMEKKMDEMMLRIKDDLRRVKDLQERELAESTKIDPSADDKRWSEQTAPTINQRISNQRRVGQESERMSKDLSQAFKDASANKIWDEAAKKKLQEMSQLMKDISAEKSPEAVKSLNQAKDGKDAESRKDNLENSRAAQQDIADDLKDALSRMEQWEDFQEIVRLTKDILQRHKKALEDIKQTTADTPSAKEAVKESEKSVQKDIETLESKMQRVSQKLQESQPYYAQKLDQAQAMMSQNLLKENMREAVEALNQNMGGKAIDKANQVESGLSQLLSFLEDKVSRDELSQKLERLESRMNELNQLKDEESKIDEKAGQLSQDEQKSPDKSLTPEQKKELERLKQRQKELEKKANALADELEKEKEKKAAKGMKAASGKMGSASENMSQGKPKSAKEDTEEALKELERVYELMREKADQLQDQERQQKLDELEQMLRDIREKEDIIHQDTAELDQKRPADNQWPRENIITLKKLGKDQTELARLTAEVEQKLKAENSIVFTQALALIGDDMNKVGKFLADEYRTDRYTLAIEEDIIRRLDELIKAFKNEKLRRKAPLQKGGSGGGGGGQDSLLPLIVELRMLKTLQEGLKSDTDKFKKNNAGGQTAGFNSAQQMILRRLSEQQGILADMAAKFAEKMRALDNMKPPEKPKEE